jgi:hypothetical protein
VNNGGKYMIDRLTDYLISCVKNKLFGNVKTHELMQQPNITPHTSYRSPMRLLLTRRTYKCGYTFFASAMHATNLRY